MKRPAKFVLATFGSLGDLHPYIAVALGLRQRGHEVVLATTALYREKIEALGLPFHAVRPDIPDPLTTPGLMEKIMDLRKGPEHIVTQIVMPALRESYEDTLAAAENADVVVSHPLTLTVRLVAERRGMRWASTVLAPLSFFSVYDPPVLAPAPFFSKLRFLGPWLYGPLFRLLRRSIRHWSVPWHRLRADLGLPATPEDPMFEGAISPHLHLALCSKLLCPPQPDWPAQTVVTGFPFYDQDGSPDLPPGMDAYLQAGDPPIVFTLGSSAVMDAGKFYEQGAAAAHRLGRRALLLVGKDPRNRQARLPPGAAEFEYAPYSQLFPRAAAIVHQGGVGTTAQALRSGRPMLVMPYAHDQPDNAERMRRLGVGRTLARRRFNAERAAAELRELLGNPRYAQRAREAAARIEQEDGVQAACDALEALL